MAETESHSSVAEDPFKGVGKTKTLNGHSNLSELKNDKMENGESECKSPQVNGDISDISALDNKCELAVTDNSCTKESSDVSLSKDNIPKNGTSKVDGSSDSVMESVDNGSSDKEIITNDSETNKSASNELSETNKNNAELVNTDSIDNKAKDSETDKAVLPNKEENSELKSCEQSSSESKDNNSETLIVDKESNKKIDDTEKSEKETTVSKEDTAASKEDADVSKDKVEEPSKEKEDDSKMDVTESGEDKNISADKDKEDPEKVSKEASDDKVASGDKESSPKKKEGTKPAVPVIKRVTRSSSGISKPVKYIDPDPKGISDDEIEIMKEVKKDEGSDIEMIEESDPLAISDADVKKAKELHRGVPIIHDRMKNIKLREIVHKSKDNSNVIIIDTNTLLKGQGSISSHATSGKVTASVSSSAQTIGSGTTSQNIQTAIQAITGGNPAIQGLQSAYLNAIQQVLAAQGGSQVSNPHYIATLQQYYNTLGALQDDAYVIEAPSFIVPYVMEGKPVEAIKDFLLRINKDLDEAEKKKKKEEEMKKKEEEKKEKEEKEKEKEEKEEKEGEKEKEEEADKDEKKEIEEVEKKGEKEEVEKDQEEEEEKKEEKEEVETKEKAETEKIEDEKMEVDEEEKKESKEEDKDEKMEVDEEKEEEKEKCKKDEKDTGDKIEEVQIEVKPSQDKCETKDKVDEEEDDDKENKKEKKKEEKKKDEDIEEIIDLDNEEKKEDLSHLGRWEGYYKSALGKFFLDLGLSHAQEFIQSDLLRMQKRRLEKMKTNPSKQDVMAVKSLERELNVTKKKSAHLYVPMKTCKFCSFKTESLLVMERHLESPHMVNYTYKCNFCDFETRGPQVILFHTEAEHNVRGRLERAPAFFQCPLCPFEDNNKSKMTRHAFSCTKKFKADKNSDLPDWEPPAKIPKINRGRPNSFGKTLDALKMPNILPKNLGGLSLNLQNAISSGLLGSAANATANANTLAGRGRGRPVGSYKNITQTIGNRTGSIMYQNRGSSLLQPMQGVSSAQQLSIANQVLQSVAQGASNRVPRILPASTVGSLIPGLAASSSITIQSVQNKSGSSKSPQQPSISITPLPRGGTQTSATKTTPTSTSSNNSQRPAFVICEICDGYIKDLEQLRNHMNLIHKVKIHPKMIYNRPPLNCQKCQHRFFTDQGLERHLLGTHGLVTSSMQEAANKGKDAGRCPICGKVFQWKLLNHVSRDHKMTLKPAHLSYKCTVCTATFHMYRLFENHVYSAHSVVNKNKNTDTNNTSSSSSNNSSSNNTSTPNKKSSGSETPLKINDEITIIPQPASKSPKTESKQSPKKSDSQPTMSKEITITKVGSRSTRRAGSGGGGGVEVISLDDSPQKRQASEEQQHSNKKRTRDTATSKRARTST